MEHTIPPAPLHPLFTLSGTNRLEVEAAMTTLCSLHNPPWQPSFLKIWIHPFLGIYFFLAVALPAWAGQKPEPAPRLAGKKTPAAFALTAKPSADWFALGEPIHIQCDLKNTGKVPIWMVQSTGECGYSVEIRGEDNRVLTFDTLLGIDIFANSGFCVPETIEPGEGGTGQMVIHQFNPIKKPGDYTIILSRAAYFRQKGEVFSIVRSAKIKVHIVYKYL